MPRLLLFGGGLLCLVLLAGGVASLLGLLSPSSTTASEYTTAEVREIIRLLREDPECRDTRLGGYFESNNNSLELWQRVLGKPTGVAGGETSPIWTFTTKDGALTVGVAVYSYPSEVPFVIAYGNGNASFGLDANGSVDSAALKQRILSIKRQIDPRDSLAYQRELDVERQREQAALEAERAKEDEEMARESQKIRDKLELDKDEWAADGDYFEIRDALPVGPEKQAFVAAGEHWIQRRTQIITAARKRGKDRDSLPLPSLAAVTQALRDGNATPVTAGRTPTTATSPSKKDTINTVPKPNAEKPDVAAPPVVTGPKSEPEEPDAPTVKDAGKTREQRIAELTEAAFKKKVSLTKPYPESYGGAPRDKISVQYAVIEVAKQAGFQYDFEKSLKNTDPICRRWIRPQIRNKTCREALNSILHPVGLTYRTKEGIIVLENR